jgi:4-hydroxyphenylacetate 3-monooxygenase
MLLTGKEYLQSIRDGRTLYVGRERVEDQTRHPAFAGGARTYAALFDMKADPALRDLMTFEEGGERFSIYYLQPRSQEDLRRRTRAHRKIANFSFGLMGRTPDAVAGNITGLSMKPEVFDSEPGGNRENLLSIYRHMRRDDVFATYAIVPPPGARNKEYYQASGRPQPALRVTAEDDKGVTLNGMKMLATGAAYAHEVLIGNVMPLASDQLKESITCVIPLNLPGLSLWSRPPFNRPDMREFNNPLTHRFDESDCVLIFQDVKVPWDKVIVHDNPALSRNIYVQTPSHVMANHQCNVRFGAKLRFLTGVASLVTRATGARDIPAVRDTLARLAGMEAGYAGMIDGQIEAYQNVDHGFVLFNRRYLYAAIHWAMENHSELIDILRELMGGGQFQFPASIDVMDDPELRDIFTAFWTAGDHTAVERMKLFKLAWDLVGSDHANRAASYEKFFVGPAFAVRNYNFVNAPWDELHGMAEDFMATYGHEPERDAVS